MSVLQCSAKCQSANTLFAKRLASQRKLFLVLSLLTSSCAGLISGSDQDIFISVAAISDYTPKEKFNGKLKKDTLDMTLQLKPTVDILKEVGLSKNKIFKVGFAAESENLIENAQKKLKTKNLDLIVANLIHESMGLQDTKVSIIGKNDVIDLPKSNKMVAAKAILKEIAHRINSDK